GGGRGSAWSSGFSTGFGGTGGGTSLSIAVLRAAGVATTSSTNNATGRLSFGVLRISASAAQVSRFTGSARILFLASNSTAVLNNGSVADNGSPWSSGFSSG